MLKESSPAIIRDIAISIIYEHVSGIRQSELQPLVEKRLVEEGYIFNKHHSVRNAIWNLQDKYPDEVEKKIMGNKAIFFPKNKLSDLIKEVQSEPYEAIPKNRSDFTSLDIRMAVFFLEFEEVVSKNKQLFDLINIAIHSSGVRTEAGTLSAAVTLRAAVELTKQAHEMFMNFEKFTKGDK